MYSLGYCASTFLPPAVSSHGFHKHKTFYFTLTSKLEIANGAALRVQRFSFKPRFCNIPVQPFPPNYPPGGPLFSKISLANATAAKRDLEGSLSFWSYKFIWFYPDRLCNSPVLWLSERYSSLHGEWFFRHPKPCLTSCPPRILLCYSALDCKNLRISGKDKLHEQTYMVQSLSSPAHPSIPNIRILLNQSSSQEMYCSRGCFQTRDEVSCLLQTNTLG